MVFKKEPLGDGRGAVYVGGVRVTDENFKQLSEKTRKIDTTPLALELVFDKSISTERLDVPTEQPRDVLMRVAHTILETCRARYRTVHLSASTLETEFPKFMGLLTPTSPNQEHIAAVFAQAPEDKGSPIIAAAHRAAKRVNGIADSMRRKYGATKRCVCVLTDGGDDGKFAGAGTFSSTFPNVALIPVGILSSYALLPRGPGDSHCPEHDIRLFTTLFQRLGVPSHRMIPARTVNLSEALHRAMQDL